MWGAVVTTSVCSCAGTFTAETISERTRSKSLSRRLNTDNLIVSANAAKILGPLLGRFEFFVNDLIE